VLGRIEDDGAYANLALRRALDRSALSRRDRAMVTDLVYGVTRMRRACDWLVDRFLLRLVEPEVRRALRLGAYELVFNGVPPHAAVGEAVELAPGRARGLVNAVLRKVAEGECDPHELPWPDPATRLSYPDEMVERLVTDLGEERALGALAVMNEPAEVTVRADGYVQDLASQWVTALVDPQRGETVVDLCAGPGGKATGMAASGAGVVALDRREHRARLVAANAARVGVDLAGVVVGDGCRSPLRPGSVDRVLVDAPCTGLGVLRRRADARWRVGPDDPEELAALQVELVASGWSLLRPGGVLVYSVCTLTAAETVGVASALRALAPDLEVLEPPRSPWVPWGDGAVLLPQAAGTDGMFVVAGRRHVARARLR
jgi:16S rRNA (cytosine967-C5)-methyltransferase